jgi:phosphoribosylanthranilate isomerase
MAFRIKICGITNVDDARAATEAGADALGFNFYDKSRRFVDVESARAIAREVPKGVNKVGVFVNTDLAGIERIVESVGLDTVQLHGDEPASLVAQLPKGVNIIRAYRSGPEGFEGLERYLRACIAQFRWPDAVLIDANAPTDFGGSGELADWQQIRRERTSLMDLPLILAGGLTPKNVATAIAAVEPHGVDVASGVESSPGKKDPLKVGDFVAAARSALGRV